MARIAPRGVHVLAALIIGLGLVLASLAVVERGPVPGSDGDAVLEIRGWPHFYTVGIDLRGPDYGYSEWLETKALPSILEDQWPIGTWSLLWLLVDWAVLTFGAFVVLGVGNRLVRRRVGPLTASTLHEAP